MKQEKTQIKVNGIKQNCYRRDIVSEFKKQERKDDTVKTYVSLEEKKLPNGIIQALEVKDYPINSASVTSYADGADYRRDPNAAIENARKKVNLGDVTQLQDFIESDPLRAVRVFRDVADKLAKYYETQKKGEDPSSVPQNPQGGNE